MQKTHQTRRPPFLFPIHATDAINRWEPDDRTSPCPTPYQSKDWLIEKWKWLPAALLSPGTGSKP